MTDKLKTFREIQTLQKNAKEAETFWARYREKISDSNIDKHRAGFGADGRNPSFKVLTNFSSYIGSYGSSSVYSFDRFDSEVMSKYMVRAMNALSKELFAKAAELMRKDAAAKLDVAQKEVSAMQAALDEVISEASAEASS